MNRNIKQYLALELRSYTHSLAELEKLRVDIKFLRKAPVGRYSSEQLELMSYRLDYLTRITKAIAEMEAELTPELHKLFMAKYMTKPQLLDKQLISSLYLGRTSFYKDDATLLSLLAKKLGLK